RPKSEMERGLSSGRTSTILLPRMQMPHLSAPLAIKPIHSTFVAPDNMPSWLLNTKLSDSLLQDDSSNIPLDNGYILNGSRRLRFVRFLGAGAFGYVFLAENLDWVEPCLASTGDPEGSLVPTSQSFRARVTDEDPGSSFSYPSSPIALGHRSRDVAASKSRTFFPSCHYYAVKCLDNGATTREQRQREIQNHLAVQGHRGIIELYAVVYQEGWAFLILEYMEEGDMLRSMAKQNVYAICDVRLGEVFGQVVDAVQHCHHRGVYHRDLKPENIMCRNGGLEVALGDFGLSTTTMMSSSFGCGSAYYMSPECIGQGYLAHTLQPPTRWEPQPFNTSKNDVWCLGVVLFNMICGLTPWEKARESDAEFMDYLRHPLLLRRSLPISWPAFSLFLRIFDPNPKTRITLDALRNELPKIGTFRMTPWEIEASTPEVRRAAEAWLPDTQRLPSQWIRYETYPENLDSPRHRRPCHSTPGLPCLCPPCYSALSSPCEGVGSEDLVPCLDQCHKSETSPESILVTPEALVAESAQDELLHTRSAITLTVFTNSLPMRLKWPSLILCLSGLGYTTQEPSESNERPPKLLPAVPVTLYQWFNNVGSGPRGDFDGVGGAFPAHSLPIGEFEHDRVLFRLPKFGSGEKDNLISNGEVIKLENLQYTREMHILYAGDHNNGETDARFRFEYEDGSIQEVAVSVKNWWTLNWESKGVIQAAHGSLLGCASDAPHYGAQIPLVLAPPAPGPQLTIRRARVTQKLYETFDRLGNLQKLGGAQLVEVTLANMRPTAAGSDPRCWGGPVHVWVHGNHFYTVKHGEVSRLMPGDEMKVRVWVRNFKNVVAGTTGVMRIEIREARDQGRILFVSEGWTTVAGVPRYEESNESLGKHETPLWWDDAKFGIFIHWGIYSVPAWSPKGYYAAWYNWWLHNPPGPQNSLWNYHKKHYGEKHHEGFNLFDTGNSTHRSSVHLGPKRDFVAELMHVARRDHPELRRGTYYSMPEWFNPDFGPHGFGQFPGHLARNAYNESKFEPYTGWLEGKDYLRDIQLAHMKTLAHTYETEIMWCDLNGPNKTLEFATKWYNKMLEEGREVALNNRCGAIPDFDTPEYAKFCSIQERKWETSEGIDPVCYGYNWETQDEEYRSPEEIIKKIVDITSKNGN
ncbi:unnamed protein product, partial [Rhizoctonia solani]